MKKKKKKVIIPVIALTVLAGASAYGLSMASADEGGMNNMSQKIAERFNLNQDEVEGFFSEQREERREERKAQREEDLNQAVADGKITEDQKNAFLEKLEEMRPDQGEMQDLSREERQEKRKEHREEMESWAEENGIDLEDLRSKIGEGRGGFGKGLRR